MTFMSDHERDTAEKTLDRSTVLKNDSGINGIFKGMKKRAEKQTILILINGMILFLVLFLRQAGYDGNDDELMNVIAAGGFGRENAHLFFIGALAEGILSFLYRLPFSANYYLIFFLTVSFVSLSVLSLICFSDEPLSRGIVYTLGLNLLFLYDLHVSLQFTKSAVVLATAGILLMHHGNHRHSHGMGICGLLLLGLAFSIRFESVLSALPFFFWWVIRDLGLFEKAPEGTGRKLFSHGTLRSLGFLGVSVAVLAVMITIDRMPYQNRDWQEYEAFNTARSAVLDYGMADYDTHADEYVSIGVSFTEHQLLSNWVFADPEVFTAEKLQRIRTIYDPPGPAVFFAESVRLLGRGMVQCVYARAFLLMVLAVVMAGKKNCRILAAFLFAVIVLEYLFLGMIGRINVRAQLCIWITPLLILLYEIRQERITVPEKSRIIFVLAGLLIAVSSVLPALRQFQKNRAAEPTRMEQFVLEASQKKEELYFLDEYTIYGEGMIYADPSLISRTVMNRYVNLCPLGGWEYPAPFLMANLGKYGVTNPLKDLLYRDHTHLACTGKNGMQDLILRYLQENYDSGAVMEQTGEIAGIPVYDFRVSQ